MIRGTVEERLNRLENLVDNVVQRLSIDQPRRKDWRKTIGMFDGDPIMKDMIEEANRSRNLERSQFYTDFDNQSNVQ